MSEPIKTLLYLSLGGSILAAALLIVRRLVGKRLPSSFYYYAWLVVLLRLILPLPGMLSVPTAESREPVTVQGFSEAAPADTEKPGVINLDTADDPWQNFFSSRGGNVRPYRTAVDFPHAEREKPVALQPESTEQGFDLSVVLLAVWLIGAAASILRYIFSYGRFSRQLRKGGKSPEPAEALLFSNLTGNRPGLIRCAGVKTPILIGVIRPMVVLPERKYTAEMLNNIFLHELTHYRRKDIWYKWFAVAVCSVHWFNPLMPVIRTALDRDCELSCDEILLRKMNIADKKSYGQTLLSLAADRVLPGSVIATTFATEKKNLKERLEQIMTYRKMGKAALALLLCALVLFCGCAATMGPAKQAAETVPEQLEEIIAVTEPQPSEEMIADTSDSAEGLTTVLVSTVDELLDAIGPDRLIRLAPGEYDLARASGYGRRGNEWYHWQSCYDGYELVITDVSNMTLTAEDPAAVTICTEPRYANVINFDVAYHVTLENLTVGHTIAEGYCTGGVLNYESCFDLTVENCRLYGCGTYGVQLFNSQSFRMDGSDIYECTYGGALVSGCYDVLFENSKFYDCHAYSGVFEVYGSREVAVINSEIFNNRDEGWGSVIYSNCKGIYFGGLDIHDNEVKTIFNSAIPVTVENCRFQSYSRNWDQPAPVDRNGTELTENDIFSMSLRYVTWEALPLKVDEAPAVSEDGKVHVTNIDEFLAAIAPNTVIYLEPGVYALPEANTYGSLGSEFYYWENIFDGSELVITRVSNLTIEGADTAQVSIMAEPRYANVIRFDYVTNLKLKNFTAGHFEAPGECTGDVIRLNNVLNTEIEGCSFFGCGVIGVTANNSQNLNIQDTEIYGCRYGAVSLFNSTDAVMNNCNVHDNGEPTYTVDYTSNLLIDGRSFAEIREEAIAPPAVEQPAVTGEASEIRVSNADELLAAIGPNTKIIMEPGVYDLSASSNYGREGNDYYKWEPTFDGFELVISNATGLTIEGAGKDQVTILTTPRESNVIRFENLFNLTLRGFTAGHTESTDACNGGVLSLYNVNGTTIDGCGLFGCGILGVTGISCNNVFLAAVEIYECSTGGVYFNSCNTVIMDCCNFHDNGGEDIIIAPNCTNVCVDGKWFSA